MICFPSFHSQHNFHPTSLIPLPLHSVFVPPSHVIVTIWYNVIIFYCYCEFRYNKYRTLLRAWDRGEVSYQKLLLLPEYHESSNEKCDEESKASFIFYQINVSSKCFILSYLSFQTFLRPAYLFYFILTSAIIRHFFLGFGHSTVSVTAVTAIFTIDPLTLFLLPILSSFPISTIDPPR